MGLTKWVDRQPHRWLPQVLTVNLWLVASVPAITMWLHVTIWMWADWCRVPAILKSMLFTRSESLEGVQLKPVP